MKRTERRVRGVTLSPVRGSSLPESPALQSSLSLEDVPEIANSTVTFPRLVEATERFGPVDKWDVATTVRFLKAIGWGRYVALSFSH